MRFLQEKTQPIVEHEKWRGRGTPSSYAKHKLKGKTLEDGRIRKCIRENDPLNPCNTTACPNAAYRTAKNKKANKREGKKPNSGNQARYLYKGDSS
jgi:hypothetical protein